MQSTPWNAFLLAFWQASLVVGLVPLPGLRSQPAALKAIFSAALAIVLTPSAQAAISSANTVSWPGMALTGAFRALLLAALVMGLNELYGAVTSTWSVQTGLSYSSVLDPSKDSESTSLTTVIQLLYLLHLVALDLHLELLALGLSFEVLSASSRPEVLLGAIAAQGKEFLFAGIRWGLPYIALLLAVDIALALSSKLYEKFQSMVLSNPLKQLVLLFLLLLSLPFWSKEAGLPIAGWIWR
ncbi:MAG: flagellar biosynthetic protein FliR [Bryobacter sp.]|nr:flagellar biosynthetic protein FliR [Bryobacter sp.]